MSININYKQKTNIFKKYVENSKFSNIKVKEMKIIENLSMPLLDP